MKGVKMNLRRKERERWRDRQTNRQTNRQTDKQIDREREIIKDQLRLIKEISNYEY